MNILIVEDDLIQLKGLSYIIQKNYPDFSVYTSATYEDALFLLDKYHVDMFFLDINLHGTKSGLDLCGHIRTISDYFDTPIIFITDIAIPSLDVINKFHCRFYFSKPYQEDDVINAISSITEYTAVSPEKIQLKDIQGILFNICPKDIIYVNSSGHHKHIFTSAGDFIVTTQTFRSALGDDNTSLIRCHKSCFINPAYIQSYDRSNTLIILDGIPEPIPVGRKYKTQLEAYMENQI